jgi:hypothetical protein
MGKLNFELFRECHHFHVLPSLNLQELRDLRQQVFMQLYTHYKSVTITLVVMKILPWGMIIKQELKERKENLKSTLSEYLRLLLDEDPWLVKNLRN